MPSLPDPEADLRGEQMRLQAYLHALSLSAQECRAVRAYVAALRRPSPEEPLYATHTPPEEPPAG